MHFDLHSMKEAHSQTRVHFYSNKNKSSFDCLALLSLIRSFFLQISLYFYFIERMHLGQRIPTDGSLPTLIQGSDLTDSSSVESPTRISVVFQEALILRKPQVSVNTFDFLLLHSTVNAFSMASTLNRIPGITRH